MGVGYSDRAKVIAETFLRTPRKPCKAEEVPLVSTGPYFEFLGIGGDYERLLGSPGTYRKYFASILGSSRRVWRAQEAKREPWAP